MLKLRDQMEEHMEHIGLPKKLLKIEDLTFVLPDDFEGGLEEAFQVLIDFIHDAMERSLVTDKSEDERLVEILNSENNRRVELSYGIFELGEDKEYHLK